MTDMVRYRADPPEMNAVYDVESMTLLYHRPSGATHLLVSPASEIIGLLQYESRTLNEIVDQLAVQLDFEVDDEAGELVMARLTELERAGLIFRA